MCLKNAIFSIYIYTHLCLKSQSWAIIQPGFFHSLTPCLCRHGTGWWHLGQHLGSSRRPGWFFNDNSCLSLLQVNLKAPIPFMKRAPVFSLWKTLCLREWSWEQFCVRTKEIWEPSAIEVIPPSLLTPCPCHFLPAGARTSLILWCADSESWDVAKFCCSELNELVEKDHRAGGDTGGGASSWEGRRDGRAGPSCFGGNWALNSLHPVKSHRDADEHLLIHWMSPGGMSCSQTRCPTEFWDWVLFCLCFAVINCRNSGLQRNIPSLHTQFAA